MFAADSTNIQLATGSDVPITSSNLLVGTCLRNHLGESVVIDRIVPVNTKRPLVSLRLRGYKPSIQISPDQFVLAFPRITEAYRRLTEAEFIARFPASRPVGERISVETEEVFRPFWVQAGDLHGSSFVFLPNPVPRSRITSAFRGIASPDLPGAIVRVDSAVFLPSESLKRMFALTGRNGYRSVVVNGVAFRA